MDGTCKSGVPDTQVNARVPPRLALIRGQPQLDRETRQRQNCQSVRKKRTRGRRCRLRTAPSARAGGRLFAANALHAGEARCETVGISTGRRNSGSANLLKYMVGVAGFEPATPSSRTRCSTRLSHTPTSGGRLIASRLMVRNRQATGKRNLPQKGEAAPGRGDILWSLPIRYCALRRGALEGNAHWGVAKR